MPPRTASLKINVQQYAQNSTLKNWRAVSSGARTSHTPPSLGDGAQPRSGASATASDTLTRCRRATHYLAPLRPTAVLPCQASAALSIRTVVAFLTATTGAKGSQGLPSASTAPHHRRRRCRRQQPPPPLPPLSSAAASARLTARCTPRRARHQHANTLLVRVRHFLRLWRRPLARLTPPSTRQRACRRRRAAWPPSRRPCPSQSAHAAPPPPPRSHPLVQWPAGRAAPPPPAT
jgi:hypothetical protein